MIVSLFLKMVNQTELKKKTERVFQEIVRDAAVKPSMSPYASSHVVLVRRIDGSTRFSVAYRKLNNVTRKKIFALPIIDSWRVRSCFLS